MHLSWDREVEEWLCKCVVSGADGSDGGVGSGEDRGIDNKRVTTAKW